jgi:hypothetical protein
MAIAGRTMALSPFATHLALLARWVCRKVPNGSMWIEIGIIPGPRLMQGERVPFSPTVHRLSRD